MAAARRLPAPVPWTDASAGDAQQVSAHAKTNPRPIRRMESDALCIQSISVPPLAIRNAPDEV
jgi:hypothetical protein